MPKPLSGRAQEMVLSLLNYFEMERENGGPLLPVSAVRDVSYYYKPHYVIYLYCTIPFNYYDQFKQYFFKYTTEFNLVLNKIKNN